jgi:hypothetical protein
LTLEVFWDLITPDFMLADKPRFPSDPPKVSATTTPGTLSCGTVAIKEGSKVGSVCVAEVACAAFFIVVEVHVEFDHGG